MLRSALSLALLVSVAGAASADTQSESDVVRLPGQGELRVPNRAGEPRERLVPGGGLILSFDADGNGTVTQAEVNAGIVAAFEAADANDSGTLSALEQQAWAGSLPTRDESLANPVRFDPNLDRAVSPEEFAMVIQGLADSYSSPDTGEITLENLKTTERPEQVERPNRTDIIARNGF